MAVAGAALSANANALTINGMTFGTPVDGLNSSTQVGIQNQESTTFGFDANVIDFYIPLSSGASGTYGVGGVGESSDTGSTGGTLTMYMEFTPVSAGPNKVLTYFDDLDVIGDNDPSGFLESVEFFDQGGTSLANVNNITDAEITSFASGQQLLTVLVPNVTTNPFYAQYVFTSYPTFYGRNTVEKMTAVISPVPIPAAFPLLASALLGLLMLARRRQRA